MLAKLNTHEFAYGALTTSPRFGAAHNPWSLDRVCGGSSGGSGAAAAADLVAGTLGTDTAGSIRIPACFNGVTGLRPTWGRVSNRGVVPVAWGYDTVGPIARSAEDCALLLEAIAGLRPRPTRRRSTHPCPRTAASWRAASSGLRIGIVRTLFESELLDPRMQDCRSRARSAFCEAAGAELVDVRIDHFEHFGAIQQACSSPRRPRCTGSGCAPGCRRTATTFARGCSSACSCRRPPTCWASAGAGWPFAAFKRAMAGVDLLAAPTMPVLPPRIGEETVQLAGGEEILYRLTVIPYNSPWSLVGAPTASVPVGFVDGTAGRPRARRGAVRRRDHPAGGAHVPEPDGLARTSSRDPIRGGARMKAVVVTELGKPPVLQDVPEPERADGEALLEILAAPINPVDISASRRDASSEASPPLPYVAGAEAVGRVLESEAHPEGTVVWTGMHGLGITRAGVMAERGVARDDGIVPVPDDVDPALAASLGIAGLAGWLPLELARAGARR